MNKITKAEAKRIGYEFGQKAFHKGLMAVPFYDIEFVEACIKGGEVGEGIPYLDGWIKGWHHENIKAPW
jgi:hypothetical protein